MHISEYFRSKDFDTENIELVVTIPTYKRPEQLKLTLQSLLNQTSDIKFAVIVMDKSIRTMMIYLQHNPLLIRPHDITELRTSIL